jgi:hypothetical protein
MSERYCVAFGPLPACVGCERYRLRWVLALAAVDTLFVDMQLERYGATERGSVLMTPDPLLTIVTQCAGS